MKNKGIFFVYIIMLGLFLAGCGSEKTAGITQDSAGGQVASKASAAEKVTLDTVLSRMAGGKYRDGEVLVKFKEGVSSKSALAAHRTAGSPIVTGFTIVPNLEHVRLPAGLSVRDAIIEYMKNPGVEYAEPNYLRRAFSTFPNDTYFNPQQWSLNNTGTYANGTAGADIKMPQSWDITKGIRNVVVAVVDTGIDYNHPDLVNNIWTNQGETNCTDGIDNDGNGFIDDCKGWDFSSCDKFSENTPDLCDTPKQRDNDPIDDFGHGTHVAGTVGAATNNATGVAGIMWNVRLMAVKFLNVNGEGSVGDEIASIQYAVANGARIINASFGGGDFSQAELDTINAANTAGVLFVASAGNGGDDRIGDDDDLSPEYPASYKAPNIIAVAATDQNDRRTSFSNFGSNSVHVAAPGNYILSTITPGLTFSLCTGSALVGYDICSGTSMAAPHVSGLAGLLYSHYTSFTTPQVRNTILRYVDVLPDLTGWVQTNGRINAFKALSSLLTPTNLSATAASSSGITLSWTDNSTGEDGYKIERRAPGGGFVQIASIGPNSTTFADSGLSASTIYSYRVRAFNTIPADSSFSNEASETTPAATAETTGGGGGGCSVTARPNTPVTADVAFLLIPVLIAVIRLRRR